jgi:hypothetical protein
MKSKVLEVGEWKPDNPDFGNSGLAATNCVPLTPSGAYGPFPAPIVYSSALSNASQGGYFDRDSAANVYNYAGDSTKLYRLVGQTETDASRTVGGAYSTAVDDWWEMTTWGQTVIATNFTDVPQVITMGLNNFGPLGGSPPNARHVAVLRDFVVFGNVKYGGNSYPNRVYWSAINNSADYTIASATQCDIQDLQGPGGWVQKVIGGDYGLVFQERAVWRMTYVGSPEIFRFDLQERARGAFSAQSVIGWGNMVFFLADDGFYVIVGGSGAVPIGEGKIDRFFLGDLQTSYAYRMSAAIDPVRKNVMWAYPGSGAVMGIPNKILCYNWIAQQWTLISGITVEAFVRYGAQGYTLEGLDAVNTSIDALTPSLDSRVWTGGAMTLAGFDSNHKLNTFSGTPMAAMVDTGEYELNPGRKTKIQGVRPLVDGQAASVQIRIRNALGDAPSFGSSIVADTTGFCPFRTEARYASVRMTTSGSFNFIQGAEVYHEPGPMR